MNCGCKGTTFFRTNKTFRTFFIKILKKSSLTRFSLGLNHYLCALNLHIIILLMNEINTLVETIIKGIQEKKGSGIAVADLTQIDSSICRYFVVCQGNSPSQVEAITESVGDMVREQLQEKPTHVVGLENAQWVAMDYTDVMVHVFLPDVREYYDLEHLWDDATLTQIPDLD